MSVVRMLRMGLVLRRRTKVNMEEFLTEFRKSHPEKWWWKYERGVKKVWDFFRYDIHQGVRNLFLFFPVVLRWRAWDFGYDYDLLMRAIELHCESHAKNQRHVHWQRSVYGMNLTVERWRLFKETLNWEEEEKLWNLIHEHLKRNARGWWD